MSERQRVLLLTAPRPRSRAAGQPIAEESAPPMGLLYLAACMERHGIECDVRDLYANGDSAMPDVLQYGMIGVSFTTPCAHEAFRVSRRIKAVNPSAVLVAGGHHATAIPEDCLKRGAFDIVLTGDAETTLVDLAVLCFGRGNREDYLGVAGTVLRCDGGVQRSSKSALSVDLDSLPWPARHRVDLDAYIQKGAVVASRGCPGHCIFCSASLGRRYRRRFPSAVAEEVSFLMHQGICDLSFFDDSFTADPDWTATLCEDLSRLRVPLRWGCTSRVRDVNGDLLAIMAHAGCKAIHFGAESGVDEVLQRLGKSCTAEGIADAVVAARNAGIDHICCTFIVGAPNDTEETVRETLDFATRLRLLGATHIAFSILTPYPGSPLFCSPDAYGITIERLDWSRYVPTISNISTRFLSRRRIEELFFEAISGLVQSSECSSDDRGPRAAISQPTSNGHGL